MKKFGTSNRTGHDSTEFYNRKIFSETANQSKLSSNKTENTCQLAVVNKIYNHSSADMHEIPDNSIHLSVTSPPYNVGKDYDEDLNESEYLSLLHSVWKEVFRVLVPGGRACINVANIGRKPYIPLSSMIVNQMTELGFLMRGEIIWDKSASSGVSCAWGSWRSASNPVLRDTHEYILVFSKSRYHRTSRDRISTITKEEFLEYTKSVWTFPAESAKSVKHPAPFPVELPKRLIQLYTYSNDIILDPFIGSGTSAVAAVYTGRRYLGYDTSAKYVSIAEDRLVEIGEPLFT